MSDKDNGFDFYTYVKDDSTVASVKMKNALAKVVQAQKAAPGTIPLGRNITPRKIELQLNQAVIQSQKCAPIKIVVPNVNMPLWKLPPVAVPIIRNNVTNVMIPIRRQGEVTIPIKPQQ